MSGFNKFGIRRLGPMPTPLPRLCSHCHTQGHIRRKCPELKNQSEFKKRGTWYYYCKSAKKGTIRLNRKHSCVSGTKYEFCDSPHICWEYNECLECKEVINMGIQLKRKQLEADPTAKTVSCQQCKAQLCHIWRIRKHGNRVISTFRFKCP